MKLYHVTSRSNATAIMLGPYGFRDGRGNYGFQAFALRGVFFADRPLDENEGIARAEVMISLNRHHAEARASHTRPKAAPRAPATSSVSPPQSVDSPRTELSST